MTSWLLATLGGVLLAAALYAAGPRATGATALAAAALRALAAALLIALALDASLGRSTAPTPLVVLDASASLARGGTARWQAARRAARSLARDSVLLMGDSARVVAAGSLPDRPDAAASRARPAIDRALATGRALVLVTDGELDDPDALALLPPGSRLEIVATARAPDAAAIALEAPRALARGDTMLVRVTVGAGGAGAAAGQLTLRLGDREVARAPFGALSAFGEARVELRTGASADGRLLLSAIVGSPGDAEPRNDTLSAALEVSPAAGAVFVSTAPDYDARFALAVLRGTSALPTRGYLRVAPGQWRVEGSLAPVPEGTVREAVRAAPLVVLHGDTAAFGAPRRTVRGALALLAPPLEREESEWFATGAGPSPIAPALAGVPWDSLAPIEVARALPPGDWEGLETRRGRRFERRAALVGIEGCGGERRGCGDSAVSRRIVVVGAAGLWRWRFHGGAGADAYDALWGSVFDWLTAERVETRPAAPADPAVREGEPVRWRRGGRDSLVTVTLTRRGAPSSDTGRTRTMTLRWPAGATVMDAPPMPAGVYDVSAGGADGLLVVNPSREWIPRRPVAATARSSSAAAAGAPRPLRDSPWAYVALLALLCAEWLVRRRAGMR